MGEREYKAENPPEMKNSEQDITYTVSRRSAEILMKNKCRTNILHTGLLLSFGEILQELKGIKELRTVVVASGIKAGFSAGADMDELRDLDCARSVIFSRLGQSIFATMSSMHALFIAAIDGYCIGGGFDLALACDIIVMSQRSFFQHPGAARGFITGFGGNLRLSRAAGSRISAQTLMLGRIINESESMMIGFTKHAPKPWARQNTKAVKLPGSGALARARRIAARFSHLDAGQLELLKKTTHTSNALGRMDRINIEARLSFLHSIHERAPITSVT